MDSYNSRELCKRVVKYVLMGLVISICTLVLPKNKIDFEAVIALGLVSACVFAIVDTFVPTMSYPLQFGAGAGIGLHLEQFP